MAKVHLWLADKVHIGLAALSVTLALIEGAKNAPLLSLRMRVNTTDSDVYLAGASGHLRRY